MRILKKRTALHIAWVAILLTLPLAFFLGALPLNLGFIKAPLSEWIDSELEMDIQFRGKIHLRWLSAANIIITDVALYGSDGHKPIIELSNLSIVPNLWDLIQGQLSLREINIDGVRLNQCNPKLLPQTTDTGSVQAPGSVSIGELKVRQVLIACEDLGNTESAQVFIGEIKGTFSDTDDAWLQADIHWRDMLINLDARMGNLNTLLSAPPTYPISLTLDSEDATIDLQGELLNPMTDLGVRAQLNTRFADPGTLLRTFMIPSPPLPETTMESRLEWRNKLLTIEDFRAESAGQVLTANGQLAFEGSVPKVIMNMGMESLDLLTLRPQGKDSVTTSEFQRTDREIPLGLLKLADANLNLRIGSVDHDTLPLKNLHIAMELQAGQLDLNLLRLESDLGHASSKLSIVPEAPCPLWTLTGRLENPNLGKLETLASLTFTESIKAKSATFNIESCGGSGGKLLEQMKIGVAVSSLDIQPITDTHQIHADYLNLNTSWREPTHIQSELEVNGLPIDAKFTTGSLHDILNGEKIDLDLLLESTASKVTSTGELILDEVSGYANIGVVLASPQAGSLAPVTGFSPDYHKPIHAAVDIVYNGEMLNFNNIELAAGNSKALASLAINLVDADPEPVLKLSAERIDLVDLGHLLGGVQDYTERQDPVDKNIPDLPKLAFNISVHEISTAKKTIRDVSFVGAVDREIIEDATVSADLGSLLVTGLLNVDFSSDINLIDFSLSARDIELGSLLAEFGIVKDVRAHSERAGLKFNSQGKSIQQMLGNTHLTAELDEFEWVRYDQLAQEDITITLPHISAISKPGQPLILEVAGSYKEVPLNLWLQLSPLEQLFDPETPFPLQLAVGTDQEVIALAGEFQRENGQVVVGKLQFSGSADMIAAGDLPSLKGPLPGFEILAEMDFRAAAHKSVTLNASMGDSLLNGKIELSTEDNRNYYNISIKAPSLQTADFSALASVLMDSDSGAEAPEDTSFAVSRNSLIHGLDDYLDRIPLNRDVNVDVEIAELYANEDFLGSARIHAYVDEHKVQLSPVKVSLPGGDIDLDYSFKREESGVKTQFQAHIENLEMGGILRTIKPGAKASGLLYLDTELSAEAKDASDLANRINGHFDLALFPQNLSANVLDLWASNLILALMSQADEDSKQTNCLAARFEVEDSIMQAKNFLLDSTDIILRGKGTINLSEHYVDLIIAPQSKREKFFSVSSPVSIRGPLDDFEVSLAGTGLVGTLFRWYTSLIYVPWKWITGERFPKDGIETCYNAMDWQLAP